MQPSLEKFELVGAGWIPADSTPPESAELVSRKASLRRKFRGKQPPYVSIALLSVILLGCLFAEILMNHDPIYLDLANLNAPPSSAFFFGTDPMGRDIFSMIWYGGRISLFIGFTAAALSTVIAILYGSLSGVAPEAVDAVMMRAAEIAISIPSILIILFVQAMIGQTSPLSIAFVIGVTSWMNIAKIVRSEVRQLRSSAYILAARTMGGGFFYILRRHLLPNFIPAVMFMVVTNIGAAIGTESTLSFLGIGLPIEVVSWGSMLSQADRALLSGSWWVILIPGFFLVATLFCITEVGNYIRKEETKKCSNLS